MKRLNKIALSVMAVVAVGIGFSGCDIADESKAPLIEIRKNGNFNFLQLWSRDDDTIINKITIIGGKGKCDIKLKGWDNSVIKYGEKLPYDTSRNLEFTIRDCQPKQDKYGIELDTNFGTYYYELIRGQRMRL